MTTEEYIRNLFSGAPLLSLVQLAEVLHRSKDGLSGDDEVSRKFLPCKVRIGRRIYFRTADVAKVLEQG